MSKPKRKLHLRRVLKLCTLGTIAIFITLFSFYALRIAALRSHILDDFQDLAVHSYFHLLTEPARVRVGTDARAVGIVTRLQRAGYLKVDSTPANGEFALTRGMIQFRRSHGFSVQDDRLVKLELDGPVISKIQAGSEEFEWVELPPEHLTSFRKSIYERRAPIQYQDIPRGLVQAVLAAEDRRFFEHPGLDSRGIGRALLRNIKNRRILEGGSTITQQVIKGLLYRTDRTLHRKLDEALLALFLERRFSKQEILQVYLNEVYMGQEGPFAIHGVAEGARFYFDKPLEELTDIEQIDLAASIRSPNRASPKRHPARLIAYSRVIARVRDTIQTPAAEPESLQNFYSSQPYIQTAASRPERIDFEAAQMGYYFDRLQREWRRAKKKYRLEPPAILYTGVDPQLQLRAARSLQRGLVDARNRSPRGDDTPLQGAIVVVDPQTGSLRSIVGGNDYIAAPFNRAIDAKRAVGSTFKPIVYLAALGGRGSAPKITQSTWLPDEQRTYKVGRQLWKPANFDGNYQGWVTARNALAQSINAPTVALGMDVGVHRIERLAENMGLLDNVPGNPSILLGAVETSPLRLAGAYSALANGGLRVNLKALTALQIDGRSISLLDGPNERVLDPRACYVVTDMLLSAMRTGTGRSAKRYGFEHLATGKTGTTDGSRDCWFVGYTPELVCSVWVGYDNNASTGLTGSRAALPIWVRLFRDWLGEGWDKDFTPPPGVVFRRIDPKTGELAHSTCPNIEVAAFLDDHTPERGCSAHSPTYSDRRRGTRYLDDANRERWMGRQKKRGLWGRLKNALGV